MDTPSLQPCAPLSAAPAPVLLLLCTPLLTRRAPGWADGPPRSVSSPPGRGGTPSQSWGEGRRGAESLSPTDWHVEPTETSQSTLTALVPRVPHIPTHPSSAMDSLPHTEQPPAALPAGPDLPQRSPPPAHVLLGPEPPGRCRPRRAEAGLPDGARPGVVLSSARISPGCSGGLRDSPAVLSAPRPRTHRCSLTCGDRKVCTTSRR